MQFKVWLTTSGPQLWKLLSLSPIPNEDLRIEFVELALQVRTRFQRKKNMTVLEGSKVFWQAWLKQQRKGAERALWEERLMTFGLFALKFSIEELSYLTQKHSSKLRFEIAEALKREGLQSGLVAPPLSRDCSRVDLFVVDSLLDLTWADPLRLFGPNEFRRHLAGCSRCQSLWECLDNAVGYLRRVELSELPKGIVDDLLEDVKDEEQVTERPSFQYRFPKVPPGLKYPVQALVVVMVLFVVVRIPSISRMGQNVGDIWSLTLLPSAKNSAQQMEQWVSDRYRASRAFVQDKLKRPAVVETPVELALQDTPTKEHEGIPPKPEPVAKIKVPEKPVALSAATNKSIESPSTSRVPEPPQAAPLNVVENVKQVPHENSGTTASADRFFLRWGAFSSQIEQDSEQIMAILKKYQAETAGELELGSFYRGGRYFHFRIQQDRWDAFEKEVLELSLKSFSRSRVSSVREETRGKRRVVFLIRSDEFIQ